MGWDDLAPSKEQRPDKALRFLTKLKTPKQKQSAPSLGSTASAGNMAFSWTDPFMAIGRDRGGSARLELASQPLRLGRLFSRHPLLD